MCFAVNQELTASGPGLLKEALLCVQSPSWQGLWGMCYLFFSFHFGNEILAQNNVGVGVGRRGFCWSIMGEKVWQAVGLSLCQPGTYD